MYVFINDTQLFMILSFKTKNIYISLKKVPIISYAIVNSHELFYFYLMIFTPPPLEAVIFGFTTRAWHT